MTKRTRGRLDRNVAPCSKPTTTVIDPLHECKKVCLRHSRMNQARSKDEEKERKRDRKDRRGQEADRKKGSPTKQKTHRRNENKAYIPRHMLRLPKKGEECQTSPRHKIAITPCPQQ